MVLFVFQFYPVCNFGKFINCGVGTVRSERVKVPPIKTSYKRNRFYLAMGVKFFLPLFLAKVVMISSLNKGGGNLNQG